MKDTTLVIKKVLNAKPAAVFKAWTDPKQLAQWYGPEGFTNEIHYYDFREGGKYRLTMKAPTGEMHPLHGEFKTIKEPTKLSMTWQWENSEGMSGMNELTLVTVELKEVGGKTEMTMTHSGFPTMDGRDNHNKGWSSSFNKLEKLLA